MKIVIILANLIYYAFKLNRAIFGPLPLTELRFGAVEDVAAKSGHIQYGRPALAPFVIIIAIVRPLFVLHFSFATLRSMSKVRNCCYKAIK